MNDGAIATKRRFDMEVNTVQTDTAAIAPLQTSEETGTNTPETNEEQTTPTPAATEAFTVSISDEAKAAEETARASADEEAQETAAKEAAENVYTDAGTIA